MVRRRERRTYTYNIYTYMMRYVLCTRYIRLLNFLLHVIIYIRRSIKKNTHTHTLYRYLYIRSVILVFLLYTTYTLDARPIILTCDMRIDDAILKHSSLATSVFVRVNSSSSQRVFCYISMIVLFRTDSRNSSEIIICADILFIYCVRTQFSVQTHATTIKIYVYKRIVSDGFQP